MAQLTLEEFRQALPEKLRRSITQDIVDSVNSTLADPEMLANYMDNLLSYTKVLQDGRFKVTDYVNAVRYVSFKLMGLTDIDAYSRAFPDKMLAFANSNTQPKDIASYVSAYKKNKLVNLIFEQSLIPVHVLGMEYYWRALRVQVNLMESAKSEKVRSDAANSVMTQLKPPEVKKVELDMGPKAEQSMIDALRTATLGLAKQQRLMLEAGMVNAEEVAHSQVLDVTFTEVP